MTQPLKHHAELAAPYQLLEEKILERYTFIEKHRVMYFSPQSTTMGERLPLRDLVGTLCKETPSLESELVAKGGSFIPECTITELNQIAAIYEDGKTDLTGTVYSWDFVPVYKKMCIDAVLKEHPKPTGFVGERGLARGATYSKSLEKHFDVFVAAQRTHDGHCAVGSDNVTNKSWLSSVGIWSGFFGCGYVGVQTVPSITAVVAIICAVGGAFAGGLVGERSSRALEKRRNARELTTQLQHNQTLLLPGDSE